MNPNAEEKLRSYAESTEGVSFEDLKEVWEEKVEEISEKAPDTWDDDRVEVQAAVQTNSQFVKQESTGGPSEEVDVVAIGHRSIQQWGDDNIDSLVTYGVVRPEDRPAKLGALIHQETDDLHLYGVQNKYKPFNSLKAEYRIDESTEVQDAYICNAVSSTDVRVEKAEMDYDQKKEWIHNNFITDAANINNIGDFISQGGSDGFADAFGVDMKRLEATVVDHFVSSNGETAGYIVQDESFVQPNELGEEITGGDEYRTPGLTCFLDPSLLEYGEGSVLNLYGSIAINNSGQVIMNVVGIDPVIPNDIELDGEATEDQAEVEQTTI